MKGPEPGEPPKNRGRLIAKKAPYNSTSAFTQLYEHSHLLVFRYIYGLLGGPRQEVEDLTAETYTRAWSARNRFEGSETAAVGWLLKIARNLVIDYRRRKKNRFVREYFEDVFIPAPGQTPEVQVVFREQSKILWNMLNTLPETHKEMLILRYMLGWRVKEVASYLDLKENTVSVTIRRILNRIRKNWTEAEEIYRE